MELTAREWEVLRRFAQYLTTPGKLRYSDKWGAYMICNETVLMQDELEVLIKIATAL